MPVKLSGSCHCGAVRFTVDSSTPVPYQLCLCSICRKIGGIGGSINLGAHSNTLAVEGKENVSIYKAVMNRDTPEEHRATSERNFCSKCSAMLWLYDETWPEYIHPFASAIDSPELKVPDTLVCIKVGSKPAYVRLPEGNKKTYKNHGPYSLEEWHKKHNEYVEWYRKCLRWSIYLANTDFDEMYIAQLVNIASLTWSRLMQNTRMYYNFSRDIIMGTSSDITYTLRPTWAASFDYLPSRRGTENIFGTTCISPLQQNDLWIGRLTIWQDAVPFPHMLNDPNRIFESQLGRFGSSAVACSNMRPPNKVAIQNRT